MRVWVSEDGTVAVHLFGNGTMRVLTREHPDAVWGPPVVVIEEPQR